MKSEQTKRWWRRMRQVTWLSLDVVGLFMVLSFSAAWFPQTLSSCDARSAAACTTTTTCDTCWRTNCVTDENSCWPGHWACDGPTDPDTGDCLGSTYWEEGGCKTTCTPESYDCHCTTTETCNWEKCEGNQSGGCSNLYCYGTCGAGANCECRDAPNPGCNSAADCTGDVTCPNSQTGGSYWSCQAHACIAVCVGDKSSSSSSSSAAPTATTVPATATPGPTATRAPRATPTRTPIPTPRPIPQPVCPPDPENYGGSVTSVVAPPTPAVLVNSAPPNPIVVGQDATKRGVDLNTAINVDACTINWHYRVMEDYIYCGKASCDCTKDNCELRQRPVEWDQTCTEPYPIAGVSIRGDLSTDSVNYINGAMQQIYPGAKVKQGTITFFPNVLAHVYSYIVDNTTTWAMQGNKYPLQDPGAWDVTVNVATQATTHCGPLQWIIPFPKKIPVFLREQILVK